MSMAADPEVQPFALEVNEVQEYDSDDVSYRLRLLVKNNYFLPPAHSKPSPADFAPLPDPQKKSPRIGAPTFLDIFRVGKARSKPTTPTGAYNPGGPMLRTTSESITAPHTVRQPGAAGPSGHPSPPLVAPPVRGRVVVVREKMQDISIAAKQAEQDLKSRGVRVEHQGSQKSAPASENNVIDPTDAVDIPLPSPSYPFAVQTSALHGLGVLESLGADVLADHLPPSQNPNLSASYDAVEDSWRKAILKQAVHHSLDNTPDASMVSQPTDSSSPLQSMQAAPLAVQNIIGHRIIDLSKELASSDSKPPASNLPRPKSAQSRASTSKGRSQLAVLTASSSDAASRPISYQRVDTPSSPMTPLEPPPRRVFINPAYSQSQTELQTPAASPDVSVEVSGRNLRRTVSSPLLAEGYDSQGSRYETMSPPPVPGYPRHSQGTFTSFGTMPLGYDVYGSPSDHHETDNEGEEEGKGAASLRSELLSRPSLSDYSQASQSPTTSTFQDMLNRDAPSRASSAVGATRYSMDQQRRFAASPGPRVTATSPPPREPSVLTHAALPPPPRSSSFGYHTAGGGGGGALPQSNGSRMYRARQPTAEAPHLQIYAPEPSSPPLPLPGGRGLSNRSAIYIPDSVDLSSALHAAPGPSSPTSFFDSLQAQPNAMDDLESSDESDDEEEVLHPPQTFGDGRGRATSSASEGARTPIMRLGNLSVPVMRPGEAGRLDMSPVENTAQGAAVRPSKSDVIASSDFFRYAQENPPALPVRPATADQPGGAWRGGSQTAQDSLRKLDGMLIQHMEDEKDTIKRIATGLKQTAAEAAAAAAGRPYRR